MDYIHPFDILLACIRTWTSLHKSPQLGCNPTTKDDPSCSTSLQGFNSKFSVLRTSNSKADLGLAVYAAVFGLRAVNQEIKVFLASQEVLMIHG